MDRYLTDRAQSLLNAPAQERINEIQRKHIIEHPNYIGFYNRLQNLFDRSPEFGIKGMLLVGSSRMGKSQIVHDFYLNNPHFHNDDGDLEIPVVYIILGEDPSPKTLWANFVDALNIPMSLTASRVAMKRTVIRKLRAVNTRMIIIDEFQHAENTTTATQQSTLLNLVKNLFEELHIPVVLCGIRPALDTLQGDTQLLGRLHPFDVFPNWDFSDETRELIGDIERMIPLKHSSDLHQTMLTHIILDKTNGITQYMVDFIKMAAISAIKDGSERITEKTLRELNWIVPEKNYETAVNQISGLFANPR